MVHGNYYVIHIVYDEFLQKILTLTCALNALVTIWISQRLIGQLNCHMMKTFAYLINNQCLSCNSYHEPKLNKYDHHKERLYLLSCSPL